MKETADYGVVLLAAGQGTRMKCSLPKVLCEIGGEPLIIHILRRILEVESEIGRRASIAIVVGYQHEKVKEAVSQHHLFSKLVKEGQIQFILQSERLGTGHAAKIAMESPWSEQIGQGKPILVLPGDFPLISVELIREMIDSLGRSVALRMLTTELDNPTGYGRVIRRGKKGRVLKIVEEKDASSREKEIKEVVTSIYFFNSGFLRSGLKRISNKNAQNEYYLPDLVALAARTGKTIDVLSWSRAEELRGINDQWELAEAAKILKLKCLKRWALLGVCFIDPETVGIDASVTLEENVTVHPGAQLRGSTQIGKGSVIGPHAVLENAKIGERVHIKAGTVIQDSEVQDDAKVGPYAHLRPESVVGRKSKIGNFVELKKSKIGDKTNIAHLSYLGDAEVGQNVNIGCGFITCNFDGRVIGGQRKHQTVIEDDVFMGSDCQVIAPIRIGKGAYVASGSTLNKNVEAGSFSIARSRQENKPGYAQRIMKMSGLSNRLSEADESGA